MCHASGADTALEAKPSENLRRYISGTKSKTVRNLFELSVPQSRADDELRAVVEVAESRDLCVVCYARSPTSVVRALKYGTNIINLANYADGEALDALEAAKDRAVVIPAIGMVGTHRGDRVFNTACALAESSVGVTIVDPLSLLLGGRLYLAIRPFEPAAQVSPSMARARFRTWPRPSSRGPGGSGRDRRKARLVRPFQASRVFAGKEYLQGK